MKNFTLVIFLLFNLYFFTSYGQEICNNGLDDDADGFIDLADTLDCICENLFTSTPSLFPNPSFEDNTCIPNNFASPLSPTMNCLDGWIQASAASSDYLHLNGFYQSSIAPLPIPDGLGMVGFFNLQGYQEYVGTCLSNNIIQDSIYMFNFNLGFPPEGLNDTSNVIYLSFFGSNSCVNLPFGNTLTDDCPANYSGWDEIASYQFSGVEEWIDTNIIFTALDNYEALVIGGSCINIAGATFGYFFLDNLIINTISSFPIEESEIDSIKLNCNTYKLFVENNSNGYNVQWYKNDAALVGETQDTLIISNDINGAYLARISLADNCFLSNSLDINNSFGAVAIDTLKIDCNTIQLSVQDSPNTNFQWYKNDLEITSSLGSNLIIQNELNGNYSVYLSNTEFCYKSDSILIDTQIIPQSIDSAKLGCNIYQLTVNHSLNNSISWYKNNSALQNTTGNEITIEDSIQGNYYAVISNSNFCYVTDTVTLEMDANPELNIEGENYFNFLLNSNHELQLITNIPNYEITWQNNANLSCEDCLTTSYYAEKIDTLKVEIYNLNNQCKNFLEIFISVFELDSIAPIILIDTSNCVINVPNVFTPNDDGNNDDFEIYFGNCYEEIVQFSIFNRFGELINDASNLVITQNKISWNGTFNNSLLTTDVFYYVLHIKRNDGAVEHIKGNITLLN